MCTLKGRFLLSATCRKLRSMVSRRPANEISSASTVTVPDSIFERSRMSLMRLNRSEPEEWILRAKSTCLGKRLLVALSANCWLRMRIELRGRAQLVGHVGEELGLVLGCENQFGGLFLQRAAGLLDLSVLQLDLGVLRGKQSCLGAKLLIGLLQLALARLELDGQLLRLLEQALGAHRRLDRVEHHADTRRELIEEDEVRGGKGFEGGQLDDCLDLSFEKQGQYHDIRGRGVPKTGTDAGIVRRHVAEENALLRDGALADDTLAEPDTVRLAGPLGIAGQQPQRGLLAIADGHLVNGPLLSLHKRHQIGQERLRDGEEVALALEHAGEAGDVGLQPVLLLVALGGLAQVGDHGVDVVLQLGHLALGIDLDRASQVTLSHRGRHLGDGADLGGEIAGEQIHVVGEIAPRAGRAGDAGLTAESPFHTDLARDTDHLLGEGRQRVGHVVDGLGERGDLALGLDGEFLTQVAVGDGRHDLHNSADLVGKVGGHEVHVVGQVFPRTAHAGHLSLATELALGADFTRHARHLGGEAVELVDHGVDRVLQLQDFALHVDGDLAAEVAPRHGGGDFSDIADLRGKIRAHRVDRVGEVFPRARHAGHDGLYAEAPFSTDLTRHPRHLRCERAELLDHGIDGLLELEDLTAHVHGDLLGEVAVGDGNGDFSDVADLAGEVGGHRVHVVGEVLPGAGHAEHLRLAAELAFGADLARHPRHFRGEGAQLLHHGIHGFLELQNLALHVHGDLATEVPLGNRRGHVGDVADLAGEVGGHRVHVVGEVLPGARDAGHRCLTAELALGADLARHARHFRRERAELLDHGVDGLFQFQNLASYGDGDLLGQVTVGDGDGHLGNVADLRGEIRCHRVHVVGEVLPGAGHTFDLSLAAELALGADFTRHATHFGGKPVELIDHGVDRVLQLENFTAHVHRDLAGEVAAGHGGGDLGDVADLAGEVRRHEVHVVGEVLPGAGNPRHLRLAAKRPFGADLARHATHFGGEAVELVDHRVDRVLQGQDLAAHGDRDFLGQVAVGNGGGDLGDVPNLRSQVGGHRVDRVGEVLPGAGHAAHLCLAAELAFGADLARHARHLASKRVKLVHHRVEGILQLQNLAFHIDGNLLGQVAVGNGRGHVGDVADLAGEVGGHRVHVVGEVLPGAGNAPDLSLPAKLALGAYLARHARHLGGEAVELVHHRVDRVLQGQDLALHVDGNLAAKVSLGDGRGDHGNVTNLRGEVRRHRIDRVGEILPGTGHAAHLCLAAELALGADLARHARHLASKGVELVHHRVDRVLQLENLTADIHRDLLGEVAVGNRGGDFGNVADLAGEVRRHEVHVVGEVLPGAGHAPDLCLPTELTLGSDFARHARDLGGEAVELVNHSVDRVLQSQDLALHVDGDLAAEVSLGDSRGDLGNVTNLRGEVRRHRVDRVGKVFPGAGHARHGRLAAERPFGAYFAGHARDFRGEPIELVHHRVDGLLELQNLALHIHRDLPREVTAGYGGGDRRDVADLRGQV